MWIYIPLIFALEFAVSFLLNSGSLAIISRKPSRAVVLSLITNVFTWGSFYLVVELGDWSIPLIASATAGDMLGDFMVARRRPRKKKPYLKKIPVSTA